MTKLYVYSEWNNSTYSTVDFFYATSKAHAKNLLQELYRDNYQDCRRYQKIIDYQRTKYLHDSDRYNKEVKQLRKEVTSENIKKLREVKKPQSSNDYFENYQDAIFFKQFDNNKRHLLINLPFFEYEMDEKEFVKFGMESLKQLRVNTNIHRYKQDGD